MAEWNRIALPASDAARRAPRSGAAWLAITSALAVVFVGVALITNSGRFALPLDDSYIFLQYARQAAHGQILRYTPGDEASSGATSPLYLLLLSVAHLAGIRGAAFPFLPIVLGIVGLAASAACARRLAGRLWGETAARIAPLVLLTHGPLVWHFFAGMETCLFVPLLLFSLEALASNRHGRYVVAASLLSLTRPEGWIAASLLSGLLLFRRQPPARAALLLVPVAAGIPPLLLNLAASGHLQSNSFIAKSPLTTGVAYPPAAVTRALRFLLVALRDLFANLAPRLPETLAANDGSAAALFFAPGAILLAFAGAAASGASVPLAATFALLVLLPAVFLPVHLHWERYLVPSFPLFLLLVSGGIGVARIRLGRAAFRAIVAAVIVFQLLGLGTFAVAYGLSSHDLAFMHIPLARWIDANLPRDASVAANDIGALAYYSRRHIVDLEGLATDGLTLPARNGAASLYEAIESLPPAALITRSGAIIEIRNEDPHYTGFAAYSYWLFQ